MPFDGKILVDLGACTGQYIISATPGRSGSSTETSLASSSSSSAELEDRGAFVYKGAAAKTFEVRWFRYSHRIDELLQKCKVCVSHAGAGSILAGLRVQGLKLVVVPNEIPEAFRFLEPTFGTPVWSCLKSHFLNSLCCTGILAVFKAPKSSNSRNLESPILTKNS